MSQLTIKPVQIAADAFQRGPVSLATPALKGLKVFSQVLFQRSCREVRASVILLWKDAHGLVLKVQAYFLNFYGHLIHSSSSQQFFAKMLKLLVVDKNVDAEIEKARQGLYQVTHASLYSETARLISHYAIDYAKHALQHAFTMHPAVRPSWISYLTWQRPDGTHGFTLLGRIISTTLEQHETLIRRYVELNMLQLSRRLADRIQKMQSDETYAFLDIVRELIGKSKNRFYECGSRERQKLNGASFVPIDVLLAKYQGKYFEVLRDAFWDIFLPQQGNEIQLPLNETMGSYLLPSISTLIRHQLMPTLIETGITLFRSVYAKSIMLKEGFELLRLAIDEESHPHVPELGTGYQHMQQLEKVLNEGFINYFDYVKPHFIPSGISSFGPKKLAQEVAELMGEKLQTITLQQVVHLGLEQLALGLNSGEWVQKNAQMHFEMKPFQFEVKLEEKQAHDHDFEAKGARAKEDLEAFTRSIGKSSQGTIQMTQAKVFGANAPRFYAPTEEQAPSTVVGRALTAVTNLYTGVTNRLATLAVRKTGIDERIRDLLTCTLQKIYLPEHDLMLFDSTQIVAERLAGKKLPFPEISENNYNK